MKGGEYLDKDKIINQQLEAIKRLYIYYRQQYIKQTKTSWVNSSSFKYPKLTDNKIIKHLQGIETIGCFASPFSSKFLVFDVDMKEASENNRRIIVNNIIKELTNLGIGRQYIHLVYSGNKGYHITMFFDQFIDEYKLKVLYSFILIKTNLPEKQVEYRATFTQGIKLPLSYHLKTNEFCCFVDENFNKIEDKLYIDKIIPFDNLILQDYIDGIKLTKRQIDDIAKKEGRVNTKTTNQMKIREIKQLEKDGLKEVSTRNTAMIELGKLYKRQGFNEYQIVEKLNEWMSWQDSSKYTTKLEDCHKENQKITKWLFKKNIVLSDSNLRYGKIPIAKSEVERIKSFRNKNTRKLFTTILIHAKITSDENNQFYMSHEQMIRHSGNKSSNTITRLLKELYDSGELTLVSSGVETRSPNIYSINMSNRYIEYSIDVCENDAYYTTVNDLGLW